MTTRLSRLVSLTVAVTLLAGATALAQDRDRATGGGGSHPLATSDLPKQIYIAPGVRDNGGAANVGVATVIHCTSMSMVDETVSIEIRNYDGALKSSISQFIRPTETKTFTTHNTALFSEDRFLNTGLINQGSARIKATTSSVVCTSMIVDAASTVPHGIDLHMIRTSPVAGTQE